MLFISVLAICIVVYVIAVILLRIRVMRYVREKYDNITGLSVCWSLFGPIGPGSSNIKYYVRLSISNDKYITFYAITSLFGDIFIRDDTN